VTARHAIYWTPEPGGPFAAFGAAWLGHDPARRGDIARLVVAGLASGHHEVATRQPRRYGLHATLKPPFALAAGVGPDQLAARLEAFAAVTGPVTAPALRLAEVDGFLALIPEAPCPQISRLADAVVAGFDDLRAPPHAEELARRREAGLTPRREALLARWGYPYVFEELRFHVTLTERMEAAELTAFRAALTPLVAPFCGTPWQLDAVSLLRQEDPQSRFVLVARHRLRGPGT